MILQRNWRHGCDINLYQKIWLDFLVLKATEIDWSDERCNIFPIQLTHTHYKFQVWSRHIWKQLKWGVDVIDSSNFTICNGNIQPATVVMVETFKGTPYDTGLDQNLAEIVITSDQFVTEALDSGLLNPKNLWGCKYQDIALSGTSVYVVEPDISVKGTR